MADSQNTNKAYRIRESLKKRGLVLTDHEVNLSILYSCVDTAYHKKDKGDYDFKTCAAAIDEAYARYLKYEESKDGDADIC